MKKVVSIVPAKATFATARSGGAKPEIKEIRRRDSCKYTNCKEPAQRPGGLCSKHFTKRTFPICRVKGCQNQRGYARNGGLCDECYVRSPAGGRGW